MQENPKSTREARAKRLKSLRKMSRLSKHEFALRHDIPSGNFQNWEGPRYGGLTETGAKKVISALQKEGIICSLEWLMHGIGDSPIITEKLYLDETPAWKSAPPLEQNEIELIKEELLLFRQHHGETLETILNDDSMEPIYKKGDFIAGQKITQNKIQTLLDQDCLVQLSDGTTIVRNLRSGSSENLFTLVCENMHSNMKQLVLYDVELISAAPIIWIRRKLFVDLRKS